MIVAIPARSVKPRCYNRPPVNGERVVYGVEQATGFLAATVVKGEWMSPGCKTWEGVGIGQPTPEFPAGTPYPMAHGFDCRGCIHLPDEFKELA